MKCIVLLSGGLDSLVCLAVAHQKYDIIALTFDYGQPSAKKEIEASSRITEHYGCEHIVLKIDFLKPMQDIPVPEKLDEESARAVWVPARNFVMLSIASSIAE